jgi:hypothetical protein
MNWVDESFWGSSFSVYFATGCDVHWALENKVAVSSLFWSVAGRIDFQRLTGERNASTSQRRIPNTEYQSVFQSAVRRGGRGSGLAVDLISWQSRRVRLIKSDQSLYLTSPLQDDDYGYALSERGGVTCLQRLAASPMLRLLNSSAHFRTVCILRVFRTGQRSWRM